MKLELDLLTDREREVAVWVMLGYSNKDIAQLMNITEKTVKNYLTTIYRALRVHGRKQLGFLLRESAK